MSEQISYGKRQISLYRTYASVLSGLPTIPESAFRGRINTLFAMTIDIEVFGQSFWSAYTDGDNRNIIATDTMKNFVLQQALAFQGASLEHFLAFLGQRFLWTYPQIQALKLAGKEKPFSAVCVPSKDGEAFVESNVLFSQSSNDFTCATLHMKCEKNRMVIANHRCGRQGMRLIKLTGSSFASFMRDAYTSLGEVVDRPLFIYLNVSWKYDDVRQMISPNHACYIAAEQVRDVIQTTFHEFVSRSIQHLVYEMGTRLLKQFPQMAEVAFVAQNRLWDTACVSEAESELKVYTDPAQPYGVIKLALTRDALKNDSTREEHTGWQVASQPMYSI